MKKELLEVYQYKYGEVPESDKLLAFVEQQVDDVISQHDKTKAALLALLNKYNFKTIPDFREYEEYPYVTLFKGVDSWTLTPCIDYQGGVTDMDWEIGTIYKDPEIYVDSSDYFLTDLSWKIRGEIILTWLSLIWFEIDGPSFGIIVKTLANNSSSGFIFNDLAWDDLSRFNRHWDSSKPIERCFKATPDVISINQRTALETYPVHPYQNRWRFFRKGDEVKEMVIYGNETGTK